MSTLLMLCRYLLHLPGHGYSARLKYLLLCGSPVIYYDNQMDEFYYHLLEVKLQMLCADTRVAGIFADVLEATEAIQPVASP